MPKFNEANAAQAKLESKLEALETRAGEIEQEVAGRGPGGAQAVSPGREVRDSDELKAYVAGGKAGAFQMNVNAANSLLTAPVERLAENIRFDEKSTATTCDPLILSAIKPASIAAKGLVHKTRVLNRADSISV